MSRKKQKSQGKVAPKPQSDPWRTWSEHVHVDSCERQDFSDNPTGFVAKIKEFKTQRLLDAKDVVNQAADEIVVEAFDAKDYPVYELATLMFETKEYEYDKEGIYIIGYKAFSAGELLDKQLFITLKRIAIVGGLPEILEELRDLAPRLIRLLMAVKKFYMRKIALANAMGLTATAKKLERACKEFCMIELTGDIDTDAKRLFLERKITPDEFRAAMRLSFRLDSQATEEINGEPKTTRLQSPTTITDFAPLLEKVITNSDTTNNAVEQIAVGISEANTKIDTLLGWWEDWTKHAKQISRENSMTSRVAASVIKAIKKEWDEYKTAPLDTSPIIPAENRKPAQKRNLNEFIANMGDKKIFNSKSLNEILDVAKKDNETPLDALKRLLDNWRNNNKRHSLSS